MRISASIRQRMRRPSSASSADWWSGCLRFRSGCRSPSAMATGWSICRARSSRRRSGGMSARPRACRANCRRHYRLGRSCANAVRRSRRRRSRMRCGRARSRPLKTCFSPATGLIRGCRQPSRVRCGPETVPPIWFWRGRRADWTRRGQSDGHWVFELEPDSTIPAEYILLRHYLGEPVDSVLEAKIANYLRRVQGDHGGWPLVQDGAFDMSASVKCYFALKMIGDSVDAPHMVRAREAILSRGGGIHSNVFTRFMLAMFEVLTWRSVPVLPIEIMLLPMWSPFHLNKISYWARTTMVPLMVLAALKPRAKNPKGVSIDELFLQDPRSIGMTAKAPHQSRGWFALFRALDIVLRFLEPMFPKKLRARAIERAVEFIEVRLNGEDGLGAIYPPMANAVMMYEAFGRPADYPPRAITRRGLDKLLVIAHFSSQC